MYVDRGDAQGLSSGSFQFLAAGLKRKKQQKGTEEEWPEKFSRWEWGLRCQMKKLFLRRVCRVLLLGKVRQGLGTDPWKQQAEATSGLAKSNGSGRETSLKWV